MSLCSTMVIILPFGAFVNDFFGKILNYRKISVNLYKILWYFCKVSLLFIIGYYTQNLLNLCIFFIIIKTHICKVTCFIQFSAWKLFALQRLTLKFCDKYWLNSKNSLKYSQTYYWGSAYEEKNNRGLGFRVLPLYVRYLNTSALRGR